MDDQESGEEESSQQDNSFEVMGSNEGNRDGSDMNHEVVDLELSGTPVCKQNRPLALRGHVTSFL